MDQQIGSIPQLDTLKQHITLNKGKKLSFENYLAIISEVTINQQSNDILAQWLQSLKITDINMPQILSNTLQKVIKGQPQHWLEQISEAEFKQYMSFPISCLNYNQRKNIKELKPPIDFWEYYQHIVYNFLNGKYSTTNKEAVTARLVIQTLSYLSPGQCIKYLYSKLKKQAFGNVLSGQNYGYFMQVVWLLMTPIEQFFILVYRKAKKQLPYGCQLNQSEKYSSPTNSMLTVNAFNITRNPSTRKNGSFSSISNATSPSLTQNHQYNLGVSQVNQEKQGVFHSLLSLVKSHNKINNSLSLSDSKSSPSASKLASQYSLLSSDISTMNGTINAQNYMYFDNYDFEWFSQGELSSLQEKFFKQLYGMDRGEERYEFDQYLTLVVAYLRNILTSYAKAVRTRNNEKTLAAYCAVVRIVLYVFNRYNKIIFRYFDDIYAEFETFIAESYVDFAVFHAQKHGSTVKTSGRQYSLAPSSNEYQMLLNDFCHFVEGRCGSPAEAQIVFEAIILKLNELNALSPQNMPSELKRAIRMLFYEVKQQNLSKEIQTLIYKRQFREMNLLDIEEHVLNKNRYIQGRYCLYDILLIVSLAVMVPVCVICVYYDDQHTNYVQSIYLPFIRLHMCMLLILEKIINFSIKLVKGFSAFNIHQYVQ